MERRRELDRDAKIIHRVIQRLDVRISALMRVRDRLAKQAESYNVGIEDQRE